MTDSLIPFPRRVAALYVQKGGVYFDARGVDPWDYARDARKYAGPCPVVAHPPSSAWNEWAREHVVRLAPQQAPECGPLAVEAVRRFGGVLEIGARSLLFSYCRLPLPGKPEDEDGGLTVAVNQLAWGHTCDRPTWLYVVGVDRDFVSERVRTGGKPTHRTTIYKTSQDHLPVADVAIVSRTPVPFRDFLLEIARASSVGVRLKDLKAHMLWSSEAGNDVSRSPLP